MGISKFFGWLKQSYPESVTDVETSFFDHVYIDINVILHRIVSISSTEDELLNRLCVYIDNILKNVVPLKSLTFATDGIAPFAKIILQRDRRQSYARNHKSMPEINPLCFTPGTYFMKSLKYRLSDYIIKLKKIYKVDIELLTDGIGEAELKLIGTMINISKNYLKSDNHTSYCICSSDADIFVIIAASCIENVTIYNGVNFINVTKMMNIHNKKFTIKNKIKTSMCHDFAFTSLLLGNDYLPKLAYTSIDKIWEAYAKTYNSLGTNMISSTDSYTHIDQTFIVKMLQHLVIKMSKQWISVFRLDKFDVEIYKNYVFGLLWCFDTYKQGFCQKLDYMCERTSTIHPLGLLFFFELGYYDVNFYNDNKIGKNYDIDDEIYATLILPKCGRKLINFTREIDFEHQNIKNKINLLYETEECKICDQLHNILSDLNKCDITDKIRENINYNLKKYKKHNIDIHHIITINNIIDLIKIMKQIEKPFDMTLANKINHEPVKLSKPMQKFKQVYLF